MKRHIHLTAFVATVTFSCIAIAGQRGQHNYGREDWRAIGPAPPAIEAAVLSDPAPHTLYIGSNGGEVSKSVDGGASFVAMNGNQGAAFAARLRSGGSAAASIGVAGEALVPGLDIPVDIPTDSENRNYVLSSQLYRLTVGGGRDSNFSSSTDVQALNAAGSVWRAMAFTDGEASVYLFGGVFGIPSAATGITAKVTTAVGPALRASVKVGSSSPAGTVGDGGSSALSTLGACLLSGLLLLILLRRLRARLGCAILLKNTLHAPFGSTDWGLNQPLGD